MKLYMFRTVPLPIISSLFTVHSAIVYVILFCRQLSSRTKSCSKAVYKPVWHIPLLNEQWINSWWCTEELPETYRVSCPSTFGKLVHLVGFTVKKYVNLHRHMNVKFRIFFVFSVPSISELYLWYYFIFYQILFSYDWSCVCKKLTMDPLFAIVFMLIEALLYIAELFSNSLIDTRRARKVRIQRS
jgi:hypothetical protein